MMMMTTTTTDDIHTLRDCHSQTSCDTDVTVAANSFNRRQQ